MTTVFVLTIALTLGLLAAVVWSIARPAQRLWPLPGQRPAAFALLWTVTALICAGLLAVGVADWNPAGAPAAWRWPPGAALFVAGNLVAWSAAFRTGLLAVAGKDGPLLTTGLYARSRNPQYVGDLAMVAGWTVLCASPRVAVLALLCAAVFVLFPRAEEPGWPATTARPTGTTARRSRAFWAGGQSGRADPRPVQRSFSPCSTK